MRKTKARKKHRSPRGGETVSRRIYEGCYRGPCGKLAYPSRKKAEVHRKKTVGAGHYLPKQGQVLRTYFCVTCQAWHNGHSELDRRKLRRELHPGREDPR